MIYIFIFLFLWFVPDARCQQANVQPGGTRDTLTLAAQAFDATCLNIKITLCLRPDPEDPIGAYLKYWEPVLFIETVKKPGDYVIWPQGMAIQALAPVIERGENQLVNQGQNITPTSTSSLQSLDSSDLQFNEAHLYDCTLKAISDFACPSLLNNETQYRYASEADSILWRHGEPSPPLTVAASQMPLWSWGPLYPRSGFMLHASAALASAATGIKAVSIAVTGVPHIVESGLDFQPNFNIDKIEMIYPQKSQCILIGQSMSDSLINMTSKDGRYVWIYWHYRECCRGIDF